MRFALVQSPEVADRVGSFEAPAHATLFQTASHHGFAGRFDGAGADLPAIGAIAGVVHLVNMVTKVTEVLGMRLACGGRRVA